MAQYRRNFYGSSYYGNINAFSGTYETEEILTEEVLNSTFNMKFTAILPQVEYLCSDPEYVAIGTWAVSGNYLFSSTPNDMLEYDVTCDRLTINYEARPDAQTVTVDITTTLPGATSGTTTSYTINANNATAQDASYLIDNLGYGNQHVKITVGATGSFYFKSILARVTSFTVEAKARLDSGTWSDYVYVTMTQSDNAGVTDGYIIQGTSANYGGNNKVQVRVWMASSDNTVSPQIQELETTAGDTSNRTPEGIWTANLDMLNVASPLGVTFKEVSSITYDITAPAGTTATVTSRSSSDNTTWSARSVPYTTAPARIRLKEGSNSGYLITPLMNPASINPNLRINKWESWSDTSYLPPDETTVTITYYFLDEKGTVLYQINQPKYTTLKNFASTPITNKPYRIKIALNRRFDKASPAVENITLISDLIYEERKITENYGFSAVDNGNTGEAVILDMSTLTFNAPAEATAPVYYLEDQTQRPLDVTLYLDSTKNLDSSLTRPNWTSSATDKVWAKVKVNYTPNDKTATGVLKNYQYGGGTAVYQQNDENEMATAFTPVLSDTLQYRYYLIAGWFDANAQSVIADSANTAATVYWNTEAGLSTKTYITEKSSHNAILRQQADTTSDKIVAAVTETSTWGLVPWVSEEKIFFGSCNVNDIHGDYIREHDIPTSGDSVDTTYIVQSGDTYDSIASAYGVDASDICALNGVSVDSTPVVGKQILIPSRITLPKIDPAANLGDNPYTIDTVFNSVQSGGRTVDDSRINRKELSVIEAEVTIEKEEVVRGSVANGKDYLANPKVTAILGIWDTPNDPVQASYYVSPLDYVLTDNQVDWSSTDASSKEPVSGASYYVSYTCMKPTGVIVTIGSDYQEEGGVDHVWRSPEVKEFSGTCEPGVDFQAVLPDITEWEGTSDPDVEDIEHLIEDNDLWVKTWVSYDPVSQKYYANGSLQDRIPKDNWLPYIRTGYYYLGQDEYYLFSEPTTYTPTADALPKAENVTYVPARFANGVRTESAASNLLRNSGFETKSTVSTIFWRAYNTQDQPSGNQGVAELGK